MYLMRWAMIAFQEGSKGYGGADCQANLRQHGCHYTIYTPEARDKLIDLRQMVKDYVKNLLLRDIPPEKHIVQDWHLDYKERIMYHWTITVTKPTRSSQDWKGYHQRLNVYRTSEPNSRAMMEIIKYYCHRHSGHRASTVPLGLSTIQALYLSRFQTCSWTSKILAFDIAQRDFEAIVLHQSSKPDSYTRRFQTLTASVSAISTSVYETSFEQFHVQISQWKHSYRLEEMSRPGYW